MTSPWLERWKISSRSPNQGGQSTSFRATSLTDATEQVFIKTLRRPRSLEARKRFRREVSAYETLSVTGIPKLIEHNASDWQDLNVPLYLVLEYVPGPTLGEEIEKHGPFSAETATSCITAISNVLEACHAEEVIHRDLKPANILLLDGDPRKPVVIDFGLSFNQIDSDLTEVTRAGEEVGNRFLRLPEHASGGKDPVSDVTQLAGLLYYGLTGIEPRVLTDEDGNKPHQRAQPKRLLEQAVQGPEVLRLMTLFDRSFDPRLLSRFQSIDEFRTSLDRVFAAPATGPDDYQSLVGRLDDIVNQPAHLDAATNAEILRTFTTFALYEVDSLAKKKHLQVAQTGGGSDFSASTPWTEIKLALSTAGESQHKWATYHFELRGPLDVVLIVGADEVWRGSATNSELSELVQKFVIEAFVN